MGRAILLTSLLLAWSMQIWTAKQRPDEGARGDLLKALAADYRAEHELAFLPSWEWGWAHRLEAAVDEPVLRVGEEDLLRPHRGLWVIVGSNGGLPKHLGSADTSRRFGPYELQYFAGSPQAVPLLKSIGWAGCNSSQQRKVCQRDGGQLRFGELIFDGRFAKGFKFQPPKSGQASLIINPGDRTQLVGGIGHTDHGARHGKAPVELTILQGETVLFRHHYEPRTGLVPIELNVQGTASLRLELHTAAPTRNEMALSLGLR